jgi:ribonuclease P protein component
MLKKVNRLTKDKEFNNVFKIGKSSYDKITGVRVVANRLNYNRFGILIGAKTSKRATERNKIKRQIREIIRLRLDRMRTGFDCIIIGLTEIVDKNHKEIEKSIDGHFKKLGLYN